MKIAINGRTGRIGTLIEQCLGAGEGGAAICGMDDNPDVIIDFSSPVSTMKILSLAIIKNTPLVIGTTGFSADEHVQIAHAAQKIPIVKSPNMSLGANLCIHAVEKLTQQLMAHGVDFDLGITEAHHKQKQDQPSGTALRLGEAAQKSGYQGKPQYASLRLGDICGKHEVIFALGGEQLTLTHHADNRNHFALGAIKAAHWLLEKKTPGLYDMSHVLDLRSDSDF